jgi:hypothetical protein
MRKIFALVLALLCAAPAAAQTIIGTLPFTLQNGTIADANQVMSDFNTIVASVNANAAASGANSNITALNGLTTPLVYTSGGSSQYIGGTSSGSANAQVIASPIPSGFNLVAGKSIIFVAGFTNTGPTTLNVNSTGLINVFRQGTAGPVALSGGELTAGNLVAAYYDGTQYQITGVSPQSLVPACTIIDYGGANGAPAGYVNMGGQSLSRTTFATLFGCIAVQGVAATTTNGSPSVAVPNSGLFQVGWSVGGNNVTCNSQITAIPDGTHITLSASAGASSATTLTIGPYSQGDCSTTFNVGDLHGRMTASRDFGEGNITTATCANPGSIGSNCGAQLQTLTLAQLPTGITSSGTNTITVSSGGNNVWQNNAAGSTALGGAGPQVNTITTLTSSGSNTINVTSNNTSGAAHPILPPVALVDKYIKF